MPDKSALHSLLNLQVIAGAPVFAVYAEQRSNRLNYVCDFIFGHVLKSAVIISDNLQEWKNCNGFHINYSAAPMDNSLQIVPHTLLFEKSISAEKPAPFFKCESIYFYETSAQQTLHFDVFAAVFYFISRYEEWQSFPRDDHGRFEAAASLLFQHSAHLKPVVDLWIYELKSELGKKFPALVFPHASYKAISTIDVDNLYAYRSKGFVRTLGGCAKDFIKLDFKNLFQRLQVIGGFAKDPFDIYEEVTQFCLEQQVPIIFFFLFRAGTAHDRTVNPQSPAFQRVFKILKKGKAPAGLHPSYNSAFEDGRLQQEVHDFSGKYGEAVTISRQHFLRFDIASTPKLLRQQGILADFTMGFASSAGFRAGTSHPFYYYDFKAEQKEELLFVPFCAMDGAYFVYDDVNAATAYESLSRLAAEIKNVNGLFVTVFHDRTFYDHLYPGFGTLYKNLFLNLK